jgi:hypothetical protein
MLQDAQIGLYNLVQATPLESHKSPPGKREFKGARNKSEALIREHQGFTCLQGSHHITGWKYNKGYETILQTNVFYILMREVM